MITAVMLEGDDFDSAERLAEATFPVFPRTGEFVTLPIGQRFVVKAVNHHQVQLGSKMALMLLVERVSPAAAYDIKALIG